MLNYFNKRRKKGQSTLEYAILIIIIIGALLSIQVYIKRGIQGRLKAATDDIGDQFSVGNTNVLKRHTVNSFTQDNFNRGVSSSTLLRAETKADFFSSNFVNVQQDHLGK